MAMRNVDQSELFARLGDFLSESFLKIAQAGATNLGSFGLGLFSLSNAVPYTTRLLRRLFTPKLSLQKEYCKYHWTASG